MYKVLVADPAWPFKDKLPGAGRGAAKNYKTQSISEIMRMELPPLADDCALFLWRVASMQQEALDVIKAWGFRPPEREVIWLKKTREGRRWFGMGRVVRAEHEVCLIAIKGHPHVQNHSVRSTFTTEEALVQLAPDFEGLSAKVPDGVNGKYRHSAKPEEFFDIVECLFPGPYAEINARRHRAGWHCTGNELEPLSVPSKPLMGSGGPGVCKCNEYETCPVCLERR